MKALLSFFSVGLGLGLVACSGSAQGTPTDAMQVYATCLETQCDEFIAAGNQACSECDSACESAPYDCNPSSACDASCSPRVCDDGMRANCEESGFKVVLPDNPSAAVATACSAAAAQIAKCGYEFTGAGCEAYAATEVDAAATMYQCIAQLDCSAVGDGASVAACAGTATSTFGEDLCGRMALQCPNPACGDPATIDANTAYARSDVLDAANSCLSQTTCDDIGQCIAAWLKAIQ